MYFKNHHNITSIFQDSVWFIDICTIYFSDKQADGESSIVIILPVILVVLVLIVVFGMYLILNWGKEKCSIFRKKGNIIINVDFILTLVLLVFLCRRE